MKPKIHEYRKTNSSIVSKNLIQLTFIIVILSLFTSCVSTKSTLKNVDNNAPMPTLSKDNTFVLTEYSKDKKYGYDPDYPVNVFYLNTKSENLNAERYLNALAGPKGEPITYIKLESCCPFPTKRSEMGAGFLDVYEVRWKGQAEPIKLYLNIYERGYLLVPLGLSIKK
ncbi:2-dehydro-3-deoxyphosphooctonate aldolase [Flavobacterium sp. N1994]|uniref:2-dehydro-3-deoxyphosphooctonate aldolase n=1 Tax=Flavobacterium sp. N1994 TaxID=2986827 RepID=UPI002222E388|nr:2-dehydro-3-deoxyphosphooctonate aldolase [Flavobacterium sp. N1994]